MDFGAWIKLLRKSRKLDIQSLADMSGVKTSTISRVENGRTQVTLLTAVRLCEGLEVTVTDVLDAIYTKHFVKGEQESLSTTPTVPTLSNVEQFLSFYHDNENEGKTWLTDLLNRVLLMNKSTSQNMKEHNFRLFVPEDIQKLLLDSPVYRFEIQYPSEMTSSDIRSIYQHGGILTLIDIGEYIKKLRREQQVTLEQMEQHIKLSPSILSRLESGFTEQIKLIDVLTLDQQLDQEGILLSMYWKTYSCYKHITGKQVNSTEHNLKLAVFFILACRWLQLIDPQDVSWARNPPSYETLA